MVGTEIALAPCGCKVMRCTCGARYLQHSQVYGCREGNRIVQSAVSTRCTCK